MLALLADPNNDGVKAKVKDLNFLENIYNEAATFSQNKEVQNMLFTEELAIADWNTNTWLAEERGITIGEERTNSLYAWLCANNRYEDISKASTDSEYRSKLFEEYERSAH